MAVTFRTRALALAAALCLLSLGAPGDASPPDRPDLAYLAVSEAGYWEVWVSKADGKAPRQLTRSGYDKTRVSWFPDGERLLVSGNEGTVVIVDMSGEESPIELEQYPVMDAVISPDGRAIAFSFSAAKDGNDIWVADVDGRNARKVVRMATLQHEPVWSPDGTQIYFLSGGGGQEHDIWRVRLQDLSTEQVTVGQLYHFDIAVAANGALAFSSNREGTYQIYVQPPNEEPHAVTDHDTLDGRPTFSPDGSQLIFESTRGGAPNLWRLDLKSKSLKQLTRHPEGARAPAWFQGVRS